MDVLWAFYCRRNGLPDLLWWCSAHSLYISHLINVVHWFRLGGPVHTYCKWGLPLKEVYISNCPLLGWKVRWNLRREIGSFVLSHSPQNNCETDSRRSSKWQLATSSSEWQLEAKSKFPGLGILTTGPQGLQLGLESLVPYLPSQ